MKNLIKKVAMVTVVGAFFGLGFLGGNATSHNDVKEPVKQVQAETKQADNFFTQEFYYDGEIENGYYVLYRLNDSTGTDFIYVTESDMNNKTPDKGQRIAVTYNHDDIVSVLFEGEEYQDVSYIDSTRQYEITDESDNNMVYGVNVNDEHEKIVLENNGFKKGDIVEVQYGQSGYYDDIENVKKISE